MNAQNLLRKYRPAGVAQIAGQPHAVDQLESFVAEPFPAAFVFHGPTGVGKSCAARALAFDLGCDREFEDMCISEVPSGMQDGYAVRDLLRGLSLRPLYGSGWKLAILNEADTMTPQAEAIWLDGLEHIPPKSVIVFTTNDLHKLKQRFLDRAEVIGFDGSSETFRHGMEDLVRRIWKAETGKRLANIPENLGRFELAAENYSIRLAIQQIAPFIRSGQAPLKVQVPFIRTDEANEALKWREAGLKAAETRRKNRTG